MAEASRQCEVVDWDRFYALARRLAGLVRESGYRPDAVVAIGRGGYVPGRVLSDFLGQSRFAGFGIEHYRNRLRESAARIGYPLAIDVRGLRVLLVDDVDDTGDTLRLALEYLGNAGAAETRTAVLYHKSSCPFIPDYFAAAVDEWRWIVYPWAVAEDVGSILRAMPDLPDDPDEIARRLSSEHGIRLRRDVLLDVLAAIGRDAPVDRAGA